MEPSVELGRQGSEVLFYFTCEVCGDIQGIQRVGERNADQVGARCEQGSFEKLCTDLWGIVLSALLSLQHVL